MTYIFVDGKWHQMENHADGTNSTVCGVSELPYHVDWTHNKPTDDLCPKCFPDQDKPKPKAKGKAK